VLFLFVVMMLDINFQELRGGFMKHVPIGALVGLILLAELAAVFSAWVVAPEAAGLAAAPTPDVLKVSNTEALGRLLYTQYIYLFQACGIVLLVAMIGAIVLTLRSREGVRKQNVGAQLSRRRDEAMAIRKVPTGEGV
jgi:NADH-quinone oxidoreductase subunit J